MIQSTKVTVFVLFICWCCLSAIIFDRLRVMVVFKYFFSPKTNSAISYIIFYFLRTFSIFVCNFSLQFTRLLLLHFYLKNYVLVGINKLLKNNKRIKDILLILNKSSINPQACWLQFHFTFNLDLIKWSKSFWKSYKKKTIVPSNGRKMN